VKSSRTTFLQTQAVKKLEEARAILIELCEVENQMRQVSLLLEEGREFVLMAREGRSTKDFSSFFKRSRELLITDKKNLVKLLAAFRLLNDTISTDRVRRAYMDYVSTQNEYAAKAGGREARAAIKGKSR
jgi:hypothetical protein